MSETFDRLTRLSRLSHLQVCDFRAYANQVIYLINEHDPARTTTETPYFCYTHLLMKINVGGAQLAALSENMSVLFSSKFAGQYKRPYQSMCPQNTDVYSECVRHRPLCPRGKLERAVRAGAERQHLAANLDEGAVACCWCPVLCAPQCVSPSCMYEIA